MMRRETGTSAQPAWVNTERFTNAKSIHFDGTYWTVRRYNTRSTTPICSNATAETRALLTYLRDFQAGQIVGAQTNASDGSVGPGQLFAVSGLYPAILGNLRVTHP